LDRCDFDAVQAVCEADQRRVVSDFGRIKLAIKQLLQALLNRRHGQASDGSA
jgi:hypothetical protein